MMVIFFTPKTRLDPGTQPLEKILATIRVLEYIIKCICVVYVYACVCVHECLSIICVNMWCVCACACVLE